MFVTMEEALAAGAASKGKASGDEYATEWCRGRGEWWDGGTEAGKGGMGGGAGLAEEASTIS